MDDTEKLIAVLVKNVTPVVALPHPFVLFFKWFAAVAVYIAAVLGFMGLRDDLMDKLHVPLFVGELAILLCVITSAGISAMVLSFPDMFQKRWLAFAPVVPLLAFFGLLAFEWMTQLPNVAIEPPHGAECLACITMLALLPGAGMLYMLRKQAGVHYYISGAVALIAAAGVGAFTLRLSEQTDSIAHLLQWHYLPMIGFGLIGLLIGRFVLKW